MTDFNDQVKNLFVRQYEYYTFLFEQEQKRSVSIVSGAKVYLAFLVFLFGSSFLTVFTPEKILVVLHSNVIPDWQKYVGITMLVFSVAGLAAALLSSMLVLKVWNYDRLCDPVKRLEDTIHMDHEIQYYRSVSVILPSRRSTTTISTTHERAISHTHYGSWCLEPW